MHTLKQERQHLKPEKSPVAPLSFTSHNCDSTGEKLIQAAGVNVEPSKEFVATDKKDTLCIMWLSGTSFFT